MQMEAVYGPASPGEHLRAVRIFAAILRLSRGRGRPGSGPVPDGLTDGVNTLDNMPYVVYTSRGGA